MGRRAVVERAAVWEGGGREGAAVAAAHASTLTVSTPVWLEVPALALLPAAFHTGIDSPVSMLSSTELLPDTTRPSAGTRVPGLTRSSSPSAT